jgi:hypothetical protein
LIESHYAEGDAAVAELDSMMAGLFEELRLQPHHPTARFEPWPGKSHISGWQFFKIRFALPGLTGAANTGRLMYLVNRDAMEIYPLIVYTHKQYETRPPEKQLLKTIKDLAKLLRNH